MADNLLVTASFTRPNDTTPYDIGDLMANSTTTRSVVAAALTLWRGAGSMNTTGMVRRMRLRKTGKSLTNASFRVHLFRANPFASSAVTISAANPGVVAWPAHGLSTGCPVVFTTTGALPTNITANTTYYVIANDADSFWVATSSANAYSGTKIDCSAGAQSGVHTAFSGNGAGDNAALNLGGALSYVGKVDVVCDQAFSDGSSGNGVPAVGSEINFTAATYYALLEARAAYTPIASEVFTVEAEVLQN